MVLAEQAERQTRPRSCGACGLCRSLTSLGTFSVVNVSGGTGQPESAAGGPPQAEGGSPATDEDLQEVQFTTLASAEQQTPLPPPTLNPPLLPFQMLDPQVFERLAAEIAYRQGDQIGTYFYGRSGQKQYGLDIVQRKADQQTVLFQVKRYPSVTPDQLRSIVEDYAGPPRKPGHGLPPRRFDPRRFVVVTSASIDSDTANVDEVAALGKDYEHDLDIEVWGAEELGRRLRDASGLVSAVFGRAWAEAFCGVAPPEPSAADPRPLGLVEEPVQVLGLAAMVEDAQASETAAPAEAATLYASVAAELAQAGFPGHAALMRSKQATALRTAGDEAAAFGIDISNMLNRVLLGEDFWISPDETLRAAAEALGGAYLAKWHVLEALAGWHETGTDLSASSSTAELASSPDTDAALMCCLLLEQALVDGLFDFDPPRSMFVETDSDTASRLEALRAAAESATSSDPIVRARLRCAVADASLRINSTPGDVATAYSLLIEHAVAGRLHNANGLVASRAAYAFATHGDVTRAENLWRRAVLDSSEASLYGDARQALRSIQAATTDVGKFAMFGLSTVIQAMPNRRCLVEVDALAAVRAFEASQEKRLPDAFGNARRWLFAARVSGHLVEERLAWRQLGRILSASGDSNAIECFILAGEANAAVEVARQATALADTWRWTGSTIRGRRAAAIQVVAAQRRLVPDEHVDSLVQDLFSLAEGLWGTSRMGPNPQLEALKALASLGNRIPETAVDQVLAIAQPVLSGEARLDEIANLLMQTYWSVESRRADLAAAIGSILRSPEPPYDLWGLVSNLPKAAQGPLLPTVVELAEQGVPAAISALAAWRQDAAGMQLTARRAAATLLRRPVGHERESHSIGTQEERVAALVLGLMEADDELPAVPEDLVETLCPPVGGTIMTRASVVDDAATTSAAANAPSTAVDEAARIAAGPRGELLVAVAGKLLELVEDSRDIAGSRQQALSALRTLLPHVPADTAASCAQRLVAVHDTPNLSEYDLWELQSDSPLCRFQINTGAPIFTGYAALVSAEAFLRASDDAHADGQDPDLAERLVAAALPLLHMDPESQPFGAAIVAAVARASSGLGHHATGLLFHPNPRVRLVGASVAPMNDRLFTELSRDSAADVRAAVASRGKELPAQVVEALSVDDDSTVRYTLQQALSTE